MNEMNSEQAAYRPYGRTVQARSRYSALPMKRKVLGLVVACGLSAAAAQAPAADAAPPRIYSCVDAQGRKHVSQAPIPECIDRDQEQRNPDGSVRGVLRKPLTEQEREAEDARQRQAEAACRDRKIAERADRNLVKRYPDRAHHEAARKEAIDDIAKAMRLSQARIELLMRDKKRLDDEREFYVGKELPSKLKLDIDRNDSALAAQDKLVTQQQNELSRINSRFDDELAHLQMLWRSPPALLSC